MKKKWYICLSMTLALMVFLTAMNGLRRKEEALASRIAPKVLRFHVLANSDSPKDQALKLEVKDLLLDTIRQGLGSETAQGPEQGAGNPPPEDPGQRRETALQKTRQPPTSWSIKHFWRRRRKHTWKAAASPMARISAWSSVCSRKKPMGT